MQKPLIVWNRKKWRKTRHFKTQNRGQISLVKYFIKLKAEINKHENF